MVEPIDKINRQPLKKQGWLTRRDGLITMDADKKYSESELDLLLAAGNVAEAASALLYLCFNVDNAQWLQSKCLELLSHENEDISGLAITCLGHVARMHSTIDRDKVLPILREKIKDTRLSGRVQDALDDIAMFAKN